MLVLFHSVGLPRGNQSILAKCLPYSRINHQHGKKDSDTSFLPCSQLLRASFSGMIDLVEHASLRSGARTNR